MLEVQTLTSVIFIRMVSNLCVLKQLYKFDVVNNVCGDVTELTQEYLGLLRFYKIKSSESRFV